MNSRIEIGIGNLWIRLAVALFLVTGAAAITAGKASAMEIDNDGYLEAGSTIDDDLIIGGETVRVDGTVNGNLIAGGTRVIISGTVNGDVIAGGSMIEITGTVNGNVFAGGSMITVNAPVTGSVFCGGSTVVLGSSADISGNFYGGLSVLEMKPGSQVERDLQVGGAQAILDGTIGRDVNASLSALQVSKQARIGRNLTVEIDAPESEGERPAVITLGVFKDMGIDTFLTFTGLNLEEGAQIGGYVKYSSSKEQADRIHANPKGGVQYVFSAIDSNAQWKDTPRIDVRVSPLMLVLEYFWNFIRDLLTLTLLGGLTLWLIPGFVSRSEQTLLAKPLPSLGWGLLVSVLSLAGLCFGFIVVAFLGLALGLVTLGGLMSLIWSLGFAALGVYSAVFAAVAVFGSKLVVALTVGGLIFRLIRKEYSGSAFWPMLLGLFLFALLHALPALGLVISLIVILFGLGAIFLAGREAWQNRSTSPAA